MRASDHSNNVLPKSSTNNPNVFYKDNTVKTFPSTTSRQDDRTLSSRFSSESLKAGQRPRAWLSNISSNFLPAQAVITSRSGSTSPTTRERKLSAAETYQISAPIQPLATGRKSPSRPTRPDLPPKDTHRHAVTFKDLPRVYPDHEDCLESLADLDDDRPLSENALFKTPHPQLKHLRSTSNSSSASAPAATRSSPKSPLRSTPPRSSSRLQLHAQMQDSQQKADKRVVQEEPKLCSAFSVTTASDRGSVTSPSPSRPAFNLAQLQSESAAKSTTNTAIVSSRFQSTQGAFKAQLLRPIEVWPESLSDIDKLVTINVSGKRFTVSIDTLNRHESHLWHYVEEALEQASHSQHTIIDDGLLLGPKIERWPSNLEHSTTPIKYHEGWPAEMDDEGQLIFNLSSLHDSPSKIVTDNLLVQPHASDMVHSARATVFSVDGLPQNIDEDDWSSDFVLSPQEQPSCIFTAFSGADKSSDGSRSSTPSLTSSPTTMSIGLPQLEHIKALVPQMQVTTLGEREASSIYSRSSYRRNKSLPADEKVEIFLERDPEPYTSICHYLRTSALPDSLSALTDAALEGLDVSTLPNGLLTLIMSPVLASLNALRDEGNWLGLTLLEEECVRRLDTASNLLNGARQPTTVLRPREARFAPVTPPRNLAPTPVEERANWI